MHRGEHGDQQVGGDALAGRNPGSDFNERKVASISMSRGRSRYPGRWCAGARIVLSSVAEAHGRCVGLLDSDLVVPGDGGEALLETALRHLVVAPALGGGTLPPRSPAARNGVLGPLPALHAAPSSLARRLHLVVGDQPRAHPRAAPPAIQTCSPRDVRLGAASMTAVGFAARLQPQQRARLAHVARQDLATAPKARAVERGNLLPVLARHRIVGAEIEQRALSDLVADALRKHGLWTGLPSAVLQILLALMNMLSGAFCVDEAPDIPDSGYFGQKIANTVDKGEQMPAYII